MAGWAAEGWTFWAVLGLAVLVLGEAVLLGLLGRRVRKLEWRLRTLLEGTSAEAAAAGDPVTLRARVVRLEGLVEECLARQRRSLSRVGVVRFNAFPDVGGEQSFALALLDEEGDGVVISSLFGREQSWVYAKPIRGGSSRYPLSQEEREAIARAWDSLPPRKDIRASS